MNLDQKNWKKIMGLIAAGVGLYWGLNHLELLGDTLGNMLGLLFPFILGACIAFILNTPLRAVEKGLYRLAGKKGERAVKKVGRMAAIVITLFLVFGLIALFLGLIIPEIVRTVSGLFANLQHFFLKLSRTREFPEEVVNFFNMLATQGEKLWEQYKSVIFTGAGNVLNTTINVATTVVGGVINFFLGLVFAIYILIQKEKLGRQAKKLLYAAVPERFADRAAKIAALSYRTFSNFLSGQCLEAFILGCMFYIAMSLFHFPYAMVISVTIGFLALIPIFGAFLGCALGMFFIVTVNPIQSVWFLILFLVIQQIEGNLIYPHVVGGSVGLPSIWVLMAVTLGGNMMGVVGMLIFIPLFSVVYVLLRGWVNQRLKDKKLKL